MSDGDETLSRTASLDALYADLATLGTDIKKLVSLTKESSQEKLAEEILRVKNTAEAFVNRAADHAEASREDLSALVRRHPATSIAVAFGTGLFLAALFTRRR